MSDARWELRPLAPRYAAAVFFTPMTTAYGRAEFVLCPSWQRRTLTVLRIYPIQQPAADHGWIVEDIAAIELIVQSVSDLPEPWVWRSAWCSEHHTATLSVYPPDGATCFWLSAGSALTVWFDRRMQE